MPTASVGMAPWMWFVNVNATVDQQLINRRWRKLLDVAVSQSAKIDCLPASDLYEVTNAPGGHGFAQEVDVGMLAELTLPNRSGDAGGRKFLGDCFRRMRQFHYVRIAIHPIVRDLLAAVVGVIALNTNGCQAADDFREGEGAGEGTVGAFLNEFFVFGIHAFCATGVLGVVAVGKMPPKVESLLRTSAVSRLDIVRLFRIASSTE